MNSIQQDLWWVILGKLGAVRKPSSAEEITILTANGVSCLVSVMDDAANLDLYEKANIPYHWLPTTGGKPPTVEQFQKFVEFVDMQNALSKSVVVHCSTGRRRSGTFLCGYLIVKGKTCEEAMTSVLQANPQVELRPEQITFLQTLYANNKVK